MLIGAFLVSSVFLVHRFVHFRNNDEQIFLVLIEPPEEFDKWTLPMMPPPPNWVQKRVIENEKLRRRELTDFIYVSKVAFECGAPEQQMEFPFDGPSDVFIPLASLDEKALTCIVWRSRRERIAIDFRRGTFQSLPHGSSDAVRVYWNGVE
jgi:hypothetical protein